MNSHKPIDNADYETTGGLATALSRHGDEIYANLGSDRLREVAEKVFKALTVQGTDNRGLRRPTSFADLAKITGASPDEVRTVVDAFRAPGRSFLMPPAGVPLEAGTVIDLSHESLMRVWKRLEAWVRDEAESAQTYRRLSDASLMYAAARGGLWGDPALSLATAWRDENKPTAAWAKRYENKPTEEWAKQHAPDFLASMAFLDASASARAAELRDREEVQRLRDRAKVQRRTTVFAVVVSALLLLAIGAAAFGLNSYQNANHALLIATQASAVASKARTEQLRAEYRLRMNLVNQEAARSRAMMNARRLQDEQQQKLMAKQNRIAEQSRALAESNAKVEEQARLLAEQRSKIASRRAAGLSNELRGEALARFDASLYAAPDDYRVAGLMGAAAYEVSHGFTGAADMLLNGVETPNAPALGHVALPAWSFGTIAGRGLNSRGLSNNKIVVLTGAPQQSVAQPVQGSLVVIDAETLAVNSRLPNVHVSLMCGFDAVPQVATSSGGRVSLFDVSGIGPPRLIQSRATGAVRAMACAPDRPVVFLAGTDKALRMLDLATGATAAIGSFEGAPNAVVISSLAHYAAVVTDDGRISIFDVATRSKIGEKQINDVKTACAAGCESAVTFNKTETRIAWYDVNVVKKPGESDRPVGAVHVGRLRDATEDKEYPCAIVQCGHPTLVYRNATTLPDVIAPGEPEENPGASLSYDGKQYVKVTTYFFNTVSGAQPFYDRELSLYVTDDDPSRIRNPFGYGLATHSFADYSAPLLGRQPTSQWDDSYALAGNYLIIPGANALDAYNLDHYRLSFNNDDPVSYTVRMRDAGDGKHAVSLNFATGEVQVIALGSSPRVLGRFPFKTIGVDSNKHYLDEPQLGYDPVAHIVTIAAADGVYRFNASGKKLSFNSWRLLASASKFPKLGDTNISLSARGNYITVKNSRGFDVLLRADGRRVGSAFFIDFISRDERHMLVVPNLKESTYSLVALPQWHVDSVTIVPGFAQSLRLSPDRKTIAYILPDDHRPLRIYDVGSKNVYAVGLPNPPSADKYLDVAISDDSRFEFVTYHSSADDANTRWLAVYSLDRKQWTRGICHMAGKRLNAWEKSLAGKIAYKGNECAAYANEMYRW